MTETDEPDFPLLTPDEHKKLRKIRKKAKAALEAEGKKLTRRARALILTCSAVLLGALVMVFVGFAGRDNPSHIPDITVASLVIMAVAFLILVIGPVVILGSKDERLVQRQTDAYLESIGYSTRSPRSSDSDSLDSRTQRQRDHAWYGENNRDLDWRDRQQAQSWGMGPDEYRSNWLEQD
ncbi:hypothetical protein ACFVAJ_17115 [Agromyces sp. NPDC057679]|uniref:hypothetical protein n=1 Tax=Agromyces sp. NPDC057679 TaxID=3346207 RepID=UPI00366A80E4